MVIVLDNAKTTTPCYWRVPAQVRGVLSLLFCLRTAAARPDERV